VNIRVELLGQARRVRDALSRNGWALSGLGNRVIATHPEVPDEGTARTRLNALGLLTSGSVRIEFLPGFPRRLAAGVHASLKAKGHGPVA
jgi:hypothetical protein